MRLLQSLLTLAAVTASLFSQTPGPKPVADRLAALFRNAIENINRADGLLIWPGDLRNDGVSLAVARAVGSPA